MADVLSIFYSIDLLLNKHKLTNVEFACLSRKNHEKLIPD